MDVRKAKDLARAARALRRASPRRILDSMTRDDDGNAKDQFKQGLGLLWKAARKAAEDIRKETDKSPLSRSPLSRSIDDAGRELFRAATNVATRVGSELKKAGIVPPGAEQKAEDEATKEASGDGARDPNKPMGPTPEDPGFRIMTGEPGAPGTPSNAPPNPPKSGQGS